MILSKSKSEWISLCDSAVSTVVDNLRWAHRSTCLCIVKTYAITTTGDELSIYAITTKSIYGNLTNLVLWQLRYEVSIMTIVSYAYSHVSLTTARDDAEVTHSE